MIAAYAVVQVSEYKADKKRCPKVREKQVTCFSTDEQKRIEMKLLYGKKSKMLGGIICLF